MLQNGSNTIQCYRSTNWQIIRVSGTDVKNSGFADNSASMHPSLFCILNMSQVYHYTTGKQDHIVFVIYVCICFLGISYIKNLNYRFKPRQKKDKSKGLYNLLYSRVHWSGKINK